MAVARPLPDYGAVTRAATREERLGHTREVVEMVVRRMIGDGVPVPIAPGGREEPATGREERIVVAIDAPTPDARPGPGEGAAAGPEG